MFIELTMHAFVRATVTVAGALGLVALSARQSPARSGPSASPQNRVADAEICLRIYNVAGVSDAEIAAAMTRLDRLLNRATVGMVWEICGEHRGCPVDGGPLDFIVRLQPDNAAASGGVCGIALTSKAADEARFITIFTDCVARAAEMFVVSRDTVLTYCLAHEVGHLLLPARAHRADGIMAQTLGRVEWQRAAAGKLPFTDQEAELMHAAVVARARIAETRSR